MAAAPRRFLSGALVTAGPGVGSITLREMQNGRRYSPAVRAVRSDEHPSYFTISLAPASRVTPPNVPLKVIV